MFVEKFEKSIETHGLNHRSYLMNKIMRKVSSALARFITLVLPLCCSMVILEKEQFSWLKKSYFT